MMKFLDAIFRRGTSAAQPQKAAFARGGYEIIGNSGNRRSFTPETQGEDGIVGDYGRNRLTAAGRDMMRNSPTRGTMDQQRRVNIVGTVGGKLHASFPEGFEDAAKAVDLELTDEEIAYLEAPYVPHPLAGVMAQNQPANAKEKARVVHGQSEDLIGEEAL